MSDAMEIKRFITEQEQFHSSRISEHETDFSYYKDEFAVGISAPFHTVRTGCGASIVDNQISHIETGKPTVYREPKDSSQKSRESALKVSRFLNYIINKSVTEIDEAIKNATLYGEGIFQLHFNEDAYTNKDYQHITDMSPVIITSPDPTMTYCFPYDSILPDRVFKKAYIDNSRAQVIFPQSILENGKKEVEYISYFDKESRVYYLGGSVVDGEDKPNALGFTPFIHFYAGYGKRSSNGKPEEMAVGRLRKIRGLLKEDCEVRSRIDSLLGLYANPLVLYKAVTPDANPLSGTELKNQVIGAGESITVPYGWDFTIYTPQVNTPEVFRHYDRIQAQLGIENPSILNGVAGSSRVSGRQEDIEYGHISKRYEKLVRNLEEALSATMSNVLRILDTIPMALPITVRFEIIQDGVKVSKEEILTKDDIGGYYGCTVKLNPDEAVEDDQKFMKYRMLVNEGRISWKKFLVNGCNMTEWEADDQIAEALAEQSIISDPLMKSVRTQEALEHMGMERYIQKAQQDSDYQARMQQELALQNKQGGTGYRPTEAQNPASIEQARLLFGGETANGIRRPQQATPDQGGMQ